MSTYELLTLAFGLSMDAFAVAICKGLSVERVKLKHMLIAGIWFGGFQALMPFLGYFLGSVFGATIKNVDHWISFVLLGAIGANMIKESFEKEESCKDCGFGIKTMFIMAVATSIDAFASGIAINVQNGNIWIALIFIGVITFVFSVFGVKLGGFTGAKYKSKAEFFGGAVLILLGLKILLEDLF